LKLNNSCDETSPLNSDTDRKRAINLVYSIIKTWWEEEKSVFVKSDNDYTTRKLALDRCILSFIKLREQITIIQQNSNTLKTEIQILVQQKIEDFVQKMRYSHYLQNHESRLNDLTRENKMLKEELGSIKEELAFLKRQMNMRQIPAVHEPLPAPRVNTQQSIVSSASDQTVDAFNEWARNPKKILPSQFYYAEGELKLREKQDICRSSADNSLSLWIVNKSGSTRYLFPNPNAIDQIGGDIDVLYSITGTRRARGQNIVVIQKACVVMEDGWIEYKGLLNII
jgi:hypothetical protein